MRKSQGPAARTDAPRRSACKHRGERFCTHNRSTTTSITYNDFTATTLHQSRPANAHPGWHWCPMLLRCMRMSWVLPTQLQTIAVALAISTFLVAAIQAPQIAGGTPPWVSASTTNRDKLSFILVFQGTLPANVEPLPAACPTLGWQPLMALVAPRLAQPQQR